MINFTHNQINQISAEAEKTYPDECCGLLVGTSDATGNINISDIVPSQNFNTNRKQDRFEIDPQIRINLERSLRNSAAIPKKRIIGHYHSHPDHPALPSKTDLEMAFEPELIWVIVSIVANKTVDIKAHLFDADKLEFNEIGLKVS